MSEDNVKLQVLCGESISSHSLFYTWAMEHFNRKEYSYILSYYIQTSKLVTLQHGINWCSYAVIVIVTDVWKKSVMVYVESERGETSNWSEPFKD
jgi:hypothetical protein